MQGFAIPRTAWRSPRTGFTRGSVLLTQEMDVRTSPISIEGRCLLNFPTHQQRKSLLQVSHEVTEGCFCACHFFHVGVWYSCTLTSFGCICLTSYYLSQRGILEPSSMLSHYPQCKSINIQLLCNLFAYWFPVPQIRLLISKDYSLL